MRISLEYLATKGRGTLNCLRLGTVVVAAFWLMSTAGVGRAQDELTALVQKARDSFRPVTAEQLAAARSGLQQRMGELERFVNASSSNGQKWLKFLKWVPLKKAVSSDSTPDLTAMGTTIAQLNRDENGLDLPKFRAVANALRRYRDLAAVSQWENPNDLYGQQLDALSKLLEQYRQQPTPQNEVLLSEQLGIVSAIGQAPELVAAVRKDFSEPNAFINVSADLLKAAAEPINRSEPITDNILGTRIHGDAHTTGSVQIATVPSDKAGVLNLTSSGHSVTHNVGYNGPAVIRSTGHTDFAATKRIELTDAAFRSQPAHANAINNTNIHSISKRGGGLGSRMVSNIGWQRAQQSKGRANAIAAAHAEDRIERQFNNEVSSKLRDARKRYEDDYRRPLARRGELPDHIQFSSTKDALLLELTQAGRNQLAASVEPPAQPTGHDMSMRLHESAVNNYSGTFLGGATASQVDADQDTKFDVKLPTWLQDVLDDQQAESKENDAATDEQFKAWSLKFRPNRPLSVDFKDGKVKLTLHIERLQSGASDPFLNWDVWGIFVPELKDGGVVLRREGELDAMPTNLQGELGGRRAAQKKNLLIEFNARSDQGRGFPKTIEFREFKPEGALANAGPLRLEKVNSEAGWLTLAWDRASK